nr:uncharacterized protein LOC111506692 [Leptinotarsa decemlineata]
MSKRSSGEQKTTVPKLFCIDCCIEFPNKSVLADHMRSHIATVPFFCHLCPNVVFSTSANYLEHRKVHTAKIQCRFCRKTFPTWELVEKHEREHETFRCQTCLGVFDILLWEPHNKIHFGETWTDAASTSAVSQNRNNEFETSSLPGPSSVRDINETASNENKTSPLAANDRGYTCQTISAGTSRISPNDIAKNYASNIGQRESPSRRNRIIDRKMSFESLQAVSAGTSKISPSEIAKSCASNIGRRESPYRENRIIDRKMSLESLQGFSASTSRISPSDIAKSCAFNIGQRESPSRGNRITDRMSLEALQAVSASTSRISPSDIAKSSASYIGQRESPSRGNRIIDRMALESLQAVSASTSRISPSDIAAKRCAFNIDQRESSSEGNKIIHRKMSLESLKAVSPSTSRISPGRKMSLESLLDGPCEENRNETASARSSSISDIANISLENLLGSPTKRNRYETDNISGRSAHATGSGTNINVTENTVLPGTSKNQNRNEVINLDQEATITYPTPVYVSPMMEAEILHHLNRTESTDNTPMQSQAQQNTNERDNLPGTQKKRNEKKR